VAAPRSLWSTSAGATPPPVVRPATLPGAARVEPELPPGPSGEKVPRRRRLEAVVSLAAVALLGFGVTFASLRRSHKATSEAETTAETAAVAIRTEPPGAHIMIDGEPSGLSTPATLTGLRVGRRLQLSLELPGYRPAAQVLQVTAARMAPLAVTLAEATGRLRLVGLPPGASVWVDDSAVEASAPLVIEQGRHRLRVETADDVLLDESIEVAAGERTVTIAAARRKR
jgi:hypothetical protein